MRNSTFSLIVNTPEKSRENHAGINLEPIYTIWPSYNPLAMYFF